jgi:hypothetical protein
MKAIYFAKFFHMSTGYVEGSSPPRFENSNKKLIEACGSDSVIQLDGRQSLIIQQGMALGTAQQRKFQAFQICYGTYSNHKTLTHIRTL